MVKDLVLIGGGHTHLTVLKTLGMKPVTGLRVTLITRDIHTPYSGMLPGYIAGFYSYRDCHIDLGPLARFAGARLHHGEVTALDANSKTITTSGCPQTGYDLLSVNTGSQPDRVNIPGVDEYALAAKPIDRFLKKWEALVQRVLSSRGAFHVVVVGGGAGGVELCLATRYRLQQLLTGTNEDPSRIYHTLLTRGDHILSSHNEGVRKRFESVFAQRNIRVRTRCRVTRVKPDCVILEDGRSLEADAVLWVTNAAAPQWPAEAGLAVDNNGFIKVDKMLQSESHKGIFAVGDVAALADPRPKSGVFAVRQGPVLAHNLRAFSSDQPLRPYRPQRNFLSLITTGNRYAVASRGNWSSGSRWLWKIKDRIDRRFVDKFSRLETMDE